MNKSSSWQTCFRQSNKQFQTKGLKAFSDLLALKWPIPSKYINNNSQSFRVCTYPYDSEYDALTCSIPHFGNRILNTCGVFRGCDDNVHGVPTPRML